MLSGSANSYDYVDANPVDGRDLQGLCNDRTASCILRILTTNEAYPSGFMSWLSNRGGGARYENTKAGYRAMRVNGDHCSKSPDTGPYFNFKNACDTHDLGYDLMRFFKIGGDARKAVDNLFKNDMAADCRGRSILTRYSCAGTAAAYYAAIALVSRRSGYGVP